MFVGRKKPYTARGIRRVPCIRCGKPARFQWQACANGRRFVACCTACDVELNRRVLKFLGIANADQLMRAYKQAKEKDDAD